jgi:hypothetical protein
LTEEPSSAGQADPEELEPRETRGKCVAELIQKEIAMADAASKQCVAGLVDVVDESVDLCYIDDDAVLEVKSTDAPLPQPKGGLMVVAAGLGDGSGAKAQDPIDHDALDVGESAAHASRSSPPLSDDLDLAAARVAGGITPEPATTPNVLQLEDTGMMFLLRDGFLCPSYKSCVPFTYVFCYRANFSGQDSSHLERRGPRKENSFS